MKKNFINLLIIILLFIAGCDHTQEQKGNISAFGADSNARILQSDIYPNCWIGQNSLQKEVFRSKPWASKIDSATTDSYGFRGFVMDLGENIPKFVVVDLWTLFSKTDLKADLILSVDSVSKQKFWGGASLIDSIKTAGEWRNIHCKFTLPAQLSPEDQITIYVWNHENEPIYVDDFAVEFLY
jgi:hypothetical protein